MNIDILCNPPVYNQTISKGIQIIVPFRSWFLLFSTTLFTIALNTIKYLGATLTNQVKDLYDKNFKTLNKISKDGKVSHDHTLVG